MAGDLDDAAPLPLPDLCGGIVTRLSWPPILEHAATIVESYDTGVTLRQLFYRLVSDGTLPNTRGAYQALSDHTADPRRDGTFPALVDRRRGIDRPSAWDSADDALDALRNQFRLDRTAGQPVNLYVGCEKDALSALLTSWLDERGIPVLIVGGWHSVGYEMAIHQDLSQRNGDNVLLYIGDLDPAGEGIEDNIARNMGFARVQRVALSLDQAEALNLPENDEVAGKLNNHPGRYAFQAKYGRLFQIEVDAVPPDVLQTMLDAAIAPVWDQSAFERVMASEGEERAQI